MAERDELWQIIYNADGLPCPHYARGQCAGWDFSAECKADAIYESVIKHLTESGRLLPPGGEVSTQWAVRFTELLGHHASYVQPYAYEHNAREYAAADWRPHRTGELVNRRVTTWPDGTKLVGPWSPVVSDNQEADRG